MMMDSQKWVQKSLPDDIALKIISSLQVSDVCSLGCCSRGWRDICGSDSVWEGLCKQRWPSLVVDPVSSSDFKGWREFYVAKHAEMRRKAAFLVDLVIQGFSGESLEAPHYLKAIGEMSSIQFGFQDVQMFFLKPKLSVLVNLVGLHYCIMLLDIPAERVKEALINRKISERQVCVRWWKLGRWFHGFRLRDEASIRSISLGDLATAKETVLFVLHRGVMHEVLRVQISAPDQTSAPW